MDVDDDVSSASDCATSTASKKAQLASKLKLVKRARTYHATVDQKLDMVHLFFAQKLRILEENAKNPGRAKKPADAQRYVANMLGYSTKTVQVAVQEWNQRNSIQETVGSGNRGSKKTRIGNVSGIISKVRAFVRERRMAQQRTVAKDVLSFLIVQKYASVEEGSSAYKSAIRAVQRFLVRNGYRRGRKKGRFSVEEKESLVIKRNDYLAELLANRHLPCDQQLREVYLGESYIHHHYKRHEDSLYDPNDEQDLQVKGLHKGRYYCFAAAIQGPDPRVQGTATASSSQLAGIVPNSLWIFEGSKKVNDYRDIFDAKSFLKWFNEQLLANLQQPSLIIMDGASYHRSLNPDAPKLRMLSKARLRELLASNGVSFQLCDRRPTLVELAEKHFASVLRPATVLAAERLGHKVLFTPPYHSDLQPIELLWAFVKGAVGRKYHTGVTFQTVRNNLLAAFNDAASNSELILQFIQHTNDVAETFLKKGEVDDDEIVENLRYDQHGEPGDEGADAGQDKDDPASGSDEDSWTSDTLDDDMSD